MSNNIRLKYKLNNVQFSACCQNRSFHKTNAKKKKLEYELNYKK